MTLQYSFFIGSVLTAAAFGATVPSDRGSVTVHEWGTFTSVAGETGEAVAWAPLVAPPDLPCFVERLGPQNSKASSALVRMETPVMYFYGAHDATVSVQVGFPQGWITEWYPHATQVLPTPSKNPMILEYRGGQIAWDDIHVSPGAQPQFPEGKGASRYYAARETDSAPLSIGGQQEKMIFYRGIGNFAIPLLAAFDGQGMLDIRNTSGEAVPMAMVFENREGRVGYRMLDFTGASKISPPELSANLEDVKSALQDRLVKNGLFPKEAAAMIETWHDSWFEEGTRVIYIVPRGMVDRVLPLSVSPDASRLERVFVGRIEILSPAMRRFMETALAAGNSDGLERFGRFLEPFVQEIGHANPGLLASRSAVAALQAARTKYWQGLEVKCIP